MAMTTMVAMGATVTLTLAMVEAGAMVGAMEVAGATEGALMEGTEVPRWGEGEAGVVVLPEVLLVRGGGGDSGEEVLDMRLRPTEWIRVTNAGHEREPIKITNSSSGVPVLNVK